MRPAFPDPLLAQLSELIAGRLGLHFPRERWQELERGITAAAREVGVSESEAWARGLLSAPLAKEQIELLAGELTVGETYFFREPKGFEALGQEILPELIRRSAGGEKRLRFWSAGCCTGEEPYSLSILLDRLLPDRASWQITVLGTDINSGFLAKARAAIYGEWSFRNAPEWLKEYFVPTGERRFQLIPRIKNTVTFQHLNLAEESYPSLLNGTNAMDAIFCRNVLMYFDASHAERAVHNLHQSLAAGGWLVVSSTENARQLFSGFRPVPFDGGTLYRKEGGVQPVLAVEEGVNSKPSAHFPQPSPNEAPDVEVPPLEEAPAKAVTLLGADSPDKSARTAEGETAKTSALLALRLANSGDLAGGRRLIEEALGHDKLDSGLHYLRAMILQEEGLEAEAAKALGRALYLDPDFVLAHFALGNLALRGDRRAEAERHFSNTLALLDRCKSEDELPHGDGLSAGMLREMVRSARLMERVA